MDSRELKALEIAARMRVEFKDGYWHVPSANSTGSYRVTVDPDSCTCEDFQLRQKPGKHTLAARFVGERGQHHKGPALDLEVLPARRTYAQNWPAYNLAQTTEKRRFQELLFDLTRNLPEPPRRRPAAARTRSRTRFSRRCSRCTRPFPAGASSATWRKPTTGATCPGWCRA